MHMLAHGTVRPPHPIGVRQLWSTLVSVVLLVTTVPGIQRLRQTLAGRPGGRGPWGRQRRLESIEIQ